MASLSEKELKKQMTEMSNRKAIVYLKRKSLPDIARDLDEEVLNVDFLVDQFESVKKALERMNRGVHTVQRYCYIISKYIDQIEPRDQLDGESDTDYEEYKRIRTELKNTCKRYYLDIAALAKREYRLNSVAPEKKRAAPPSLVFEKLNAFESDVMRDYRRSLHFHWDENTLKAFEDEFSHIRLNLAYINKLDTANRMRPIPNSKTGSEVSEYLYKQIQEIKEYKKKPNSKCAKIKRNTEPEKKTVDQYEKTFYLFVSRHPAKLTGLEDILNDPESVIINTFEKCTWKWNHIDNCLTAIKHFLGCAFCVRVLKSVGVTFRYCHSVLSLIDDWAAPKRK